ncbi:MAG: TSUP family transporter, partial [Prochlorococcaceae cyanobacterium]
MEPSAVPAGALPTTHLAMAATAAMAAGAVNALAGGGTLITFPVLLALGLPPLSANATSGVALCPGYLGAAWGQRRDLQGQGPRLLLLLPAALLGGLLGGQLLLHSDPRLFTRLVPWLILLGSLLLLAQEPLGRWLASGPGDRPRGRQWWVTGPVTLAAVYGGYFGAGLSVILLAVLALCLHDSLTRLNGLKQAVALAANLTAALLFLASGLAAPRLTAVMAVAALLGGRLGGALAGRLPPQRLRG